MLDTKGADTMENIFVLRTRSQDTVLNNQILMPMTTAINTTINDDFINNLSKVSLACSSPLITCVESELDWFDSMSCPSPLG